MNRRMQGRLNGKLFLVAAVATMLTACDLPPGFSDAGDDAGADYAQVCTDAAGNAEPDSDCDNADDDYQGSTYVSGRPYMWRYYPASNLVIPAYGRPMPAGGSVRRPTVIVVSSGGTSTVVGNRRPAVVSTPSAGSSGGTLTKTGSSTGITRGGFGVKSGTGSGATKGGSSTGGAAKGASGSGGS